MAVGSGLNLTGNVSLNAESAIKAAQALSNRFRTLSENSRTSATTLKDTAAAMDRAASAASKERASLVSLAAAQAKVNAVQRESIANAKLVGARADEVKARASAASALSATREKIALDESENKVLGQQLITEERINTERARGAQIAGRTANEARTTDGRVALAEARAQTEAVRQRIAIENQEGRTLLNNARISESASRQRIAAARLQMQQEAAASAAQSRAANQLRESLAVTRGALGSIGSSLTHFGTIGSALFIGLAANAIIMDREFANVVRTSDLLDASVSQLHAEGFKNQAEAVASLREQFDALAQSLPISYKELTEIGAAANQLGVSHENLAAFTRTVAQFSATTGVSVDTASTAFGRLDSLIVDVARKGQMIGGVDHDYQGLADAINKVGVNSVATDQQIINVASQISGIANAAGLGYKEIIGFSGALASVNVSPYLARGLTTRLFTDIGNAVSAGGADLEKFAVTAGMSANQFAEAWKDDPQKALVYLFDGIRASGGNAVNVLKQLGIHSVLDQPALIRLANAADKYGKSADASSRSGGILRQTLDDAATAAGENAKQYAVISNTVQSRLMVALNRVQILFRNLGEANLGPLGDIINSVSDAALKLSQNLNEPFKLLGQFKMPFTNGQLIGFGVSLMGIVSALALLGGAGAKVGAGLIALRQAIIGINTFLGRSGTGFGLFTAGANEATVATVRLAAAQQELNNTKFSGMAGGLTPLISTLTAAEASMGRVTNSAKASASAFQSSGGRIATAYSGVAARLQSSNVGVISSFGNLAAKGNGAVIKVSNGLNTLTSAAGKAARGIGNVLGGPLGVLAMGGAGVAAVGALRDAYRGLGTTADQASVSIARVTAAGGSGSSILSSIQTNQASPFVTLFSGPQMGAFVSGTKQFQQGLQNLGGGGLLSDTIQQFATLGQNKINFEDFTAGLDKLDAGFKQLADSGNTNGALEGIQKVFSGASTTQITNGLAHMGNAVSIVKQRLAEMGKSTSDAMVIKALRGEVDGFTTSTTKAAAAQKALENAFAGNTAAAQAYLNAVKPVADASVDLNKAWQTVADASKGKTPPFEDFIKQAKENYQNFVDFQKNVLIVAHDTGASLADLSALSPDILAGAVKAGKKGEKELADVMQLKDARDAFETAIAQMANAPALLNAFSSLGSAGQEAVATALSQGASIPDAFRAAGQKGVDAFNKTVSDPANKIKLQVDDKALADDLANLSAKGAAKLTVQILGDAAPAIRTGASAAEIIDQIKATISMDGDAVLAQRKGESTAAYISRLKATLTVYGDTGPAIGKGDNAAVQIGKLQARIKIDADNNPAKQSGADVSAEITKLRTTLFIKGDNIPAQKAGESAAEYVNRLHAMLAVDANTALAKLKGKDAATQISMEKAILKIFGEDAPARQKGESAAAYIDRLKGMIQVYANSTPAQAKAAAQAAEISRLTSTIKVYGNAVPARKEGESAEAYINRLKGIVTIDASPTSANSKLNAFRVKTNNTTGVLKIDANSGPANSKLGGAKARVNGTTGTMRIDANNSPAITRGRAAASSISGMRGTMTADARTGAAESALNWAARDRTSVITARFDGGGGHFASGGLVRGPGTGTSDSIPARLSDGEYVIRAAQVKKYKGLLDAINYGIAGYANGGLVRGYASGGRVTGGSARYEGVIASLQSAANARQATPASHITELSPYDRHLLQVIADNIGVVIAPEHIANATSNVNRVQSRRGNG